MTTGAHPVMLAFSHDWAKLFPSAKEAGIVGDLRHELRGGYHISREDNPAGNYSIVRPDDQYGPVDMASAVDMSMSPSDMKACTARLVAAFTNVNDPRRKYLNAFNGTMDGKNARRWDVYARTVKDASEDHLWHIHLEIRRRYLSSPVATRAVMSILKGEPAPEYLRSIGVHAAPAALTATKAPRFPGVLSRDDRATKPNPGVRAFQVRLRARGWTSQGPSDGYFGAKMEATVKRWQISCGLKPDGVIGAKTWPTPWKRPIAA